MRVAIINTVGLNGGDAAILTAVDWLVRQALGPEVQIEVFDRAPEPLRRYHPEFDTRMDPHQRATSSAHPLWSRLSASANRARWRLAAAARRLGFGGAMRLLLEPPELAELEALAQADLVVSTGGTYLVENYVLTPRIFNLGLVAALERPLVMMTQSLGPFEDPDNRRLLAPLLDRAELILLRDPASLRHLHELGVRRPARKVVADAVFALAEPDRLERARARTMPARGLEVAVSVRHWPYFQAHTEREGMRRYRAAIAALIEHLVAERGAHVTLLSTCQGIPEYWTDDSEVAAQIHEALSPAAQDACTLDRRAHSPRELIDRYGQADLVVATRMHAAIIGLIGGTPVLPIEYEFKTRELFDQLGFGDWVVDIERITPRGLLERAGHVLARADARRDELLDGVLKMHQSTLDSAEALARVGAQLR